MILQWLLFFDCLQNERIQTFGKLDIQSGEKAFFDKHGKAANLKWDSFNELRTGCLPLAARAALRKYPTLNPFVLHIEECVDRGLTAKGHIHYLPTHGSEFTPFWLTD
jgi:hypothetical protein